MKTVNPVTPESAGLSLAVISGPRGEVSPQTCTETGKPLPGWPCIAYTCELHDPRGRVIWSGPYRLGIGHVKVPAGTNANLSFKLTREQSALLDTWRRKPYADFIDKQLQADTAAVLARLQGVKPKLNDVCHSLLMDGAAFFDGQRFEEWAGDLGYSADSIKARETFEACDRIGRDLSRALSRDELAGLREWAGNY